MLRLPLLLLFFLNTSASVFSQNTPADLFSGKMMVLISGAPDATPFMEWQELAESVHPALVAAGADPIGYFELEEVALSEESQQRFAAGFAQRQVKKIAILTRKSSGSITCSIMPFQPSREMVRIDQLWQHESNSLSNFYAEMETLGLQLPSTNFLVLQVPEFPSLAAGAVGGSSSAAAGNSGGAARFLRSKPLNLDVFSLGIPLAGFQAGAGILNSFRYDRLGLSESRIAQERTKEQQDLERLFEAYYPHRFVFLDQPQERQSLLNQRIQFILSKLEGRESDLMENMGFSVPADRNTNRIVTKYYIKFLVRDENYTGTQWDAAEDPGQALENFLLQLHPATADR
ncbi:MAG: NTPase [Nitritalea sp.]